MEDMTTLQQIRESVLSTTDCENAIAKFLRYHRHLSSLVPRLVGYENELRVSFHFSDPFRPSNKFSTNSWFVEWGSALWNLGALESQRGTKVDRSSDDGVKQANKHFQSAAGVFVFIRHQVLPRVTGNVSIALTDIGLQMAVHLMLAQAQLCFYEKVGPNRHNWDSDFSLCCRLCVIGKLES